MTRINKGILKTFVHLSKASRQHCTVIKIIHPDQNIHEIPYPKVILLEPQWKGSTASIRQVFLTLLLQHSNPHLPEWMLLSQCKAEGQDTPARLRRHLNTVKLILNKLHESREHHQHLSNACPHQCTPAFERMPEASHPFRDFYIFFINITWVKLGDGYLLPVPTHRAEHYTNTLPCFFSLTVFLLSLHRLQQIADLHIFLHIKSYQT